MLPSIDGGHLKKKIQYHGEMVAFREENVMAREKFGPLDSGEAFPDLRFSLLGGREMSTGHDLKGSWSVVLIYRGSW